MRVPPFEPRFTLPIAIAFAALVAYCTPAKPAEVTGVAFVLGSYHYDRSKEWQQINPGVVVELDGRVLVGTYRNSYDKQTILAAAKFPLWTTVRLQFDGMIGAATHYHSPIVAGLLVSHRDSPLSLTVTPSGVGLSVRVR